MFGLQELFPSWELKLLATVIVPMVAIALAYLVRSIRRRVIRRLHPVGVDLVSSAVIVGLVILTALALADIWGQTEALLDQFGVLRLDDRAPQLIVTIIVLIAVQVFTGIAGRLLDDITDESDALTRHQREVSLRVTQLTLWGGGIIVILGVWNVDIAGLLVGAGFLGIVVGLAARKTFGSMIAGFVLMFSRPFEIGDWVAVDGDEGIVTDITMMSTRIQAFDGEYVVVPNDVIGNEILANRSRNGRLRTEVEVGIDYGVDIEHAREVALSVARDLVDVEEFPGSSPEVVIDRFDDSAVVFVVRLWVEEPTPREMARARGELIAAISDRFSEEGIDIPYPQRELSYREGHGDHDTDHRDRRSSRPKTEATREEE
ncbi:mechanosensitive ion channel protein MscS [Halalkaliarchaeum desulfuricum]|uniref:Mechanosensitive ion channel protein MscS n=1 Tax=Halalkaliarchaeum desulfuricum TaxID=2055893 RepID=A0A343TMW5_9EURY|nr:mechanosensitive ion channel family protein [Halalkaliarchaeum desulfuricum]AUX10437.1 mechanosensitive ion channel protein MscS [Halalkaliarchaeum desulfuricum]